MEEKIRALAELLEVEKEEITDEGNEVFSCGREEYRVLTDYEADEVWEQEEDCITIDGEDYYIYRIN
jgi:hypothetical protein